MTTFGDCVSGCGQLIGAAAVGAMVGAPIAHYYLKLVEGVVPNSQIQPQNEQPDNSQNEQPYNSQNEQPDNSQNALIPSNRVDYRKLIISTFHQKKAHALSFIEQNLEHEALGAILGAVTQVTFVALNALAKRCPKFAIWLTIGSFASLYVVVKHLGTVNKNENPEKIAKGFLCMSLATVVASAALLNIASWVPRDMHFRAFGIVG